MLTKIFTVALVKNPAKQIGGCLFYDEKMQVLVQVLEGPAQNVRALYSVISKDSRHTSVQKLWDMDVQQRIYGGFGMQLTEHDPTGLRVTMGQKEDKELLQLTCIPPRTRTLISP